MAKKPSITLRLDARSTPSEREAANRQHHSELISATLDNAVAVGHGHAVGSQGPKGHTMAPSDANFQGSGGSRGKPYIGQAAFAKVPQTISSDGSGGGPGVDNPASKDYGVVDCDD